MIVVKMGRHKSKKGLEQKIKSDKITKDMDDICPLVHQCREPFCWNKFGNYEKCLRYQTNNPRTDSQDKLLYRSEYS